MALASSGQLSFSDLRDFFGDSNPVSLSEYYRGGSLVPNIAPNSAIATSGAINLNSFHSAEVYSAFTAASLSLSPPSGSDTVEQGNGTASVTASVVTTGGSGSFNYNWSSSAHTESSMTVTRSGVGVDSYNGNCAVTDTILGNTITTNTVTITATVVACFEENTPIWMDDGTCKIAGEIVVGDRVKSFTTPTMPDEDVDGWESWKTSDVSNGTVGHSDVIRAGRFETPDYYRFNNSLKVSGSHPFLIYRDGLWQWLRACALKNGDQFYAQDGSHISLSSIDHVLEPITVISIGVEAVDTYFGGSLNGKAVLVHNK